MVVNEAHAQLLASVNRKNIWDEQPVFCFSSDIDWASEEVLRHFFEMIPFQEIKLTTFVTHESQQISALAASGKIQRGIHPNFLPGSSHGDSFIDVAETCVKLAPEAIGFRSHRLFDVTDITHLLANKYGFKYVSNLGTSMAVSIRPVLHESRLVHLPIFFEDGSHLYNEFGYSILPFLNYFTNPGLKIISFHPMNMVFNTPGLSFMRALKDSLSREAYNNIDAQIISEKRNTGVGITNTVFEIIEWTMKNNYPIFSMNEIYQQTIA